MTTFHVTVPENKISFFKEFLKSIGAKYSENQEDFELSDEMIEILEQRLNEDKSDYISEEESIRLLKEKYGL
ncbi:MAG: hypothetical protein WCY25_07315 [Moheibacter sp.]